MTDTTNDSSQNGGCPCLYVEPCQPDCTCRKPHMSNGCLRCCRYGSLEQRKAKAVYLTNNNIDIEEMRKLLAEGTQAWDKERHRIVEVLTRQIQTAKMQAYAEAQQHAHQNLLKMRGVEEACFTCKGLGVRMYGNSATWHGGVGLVQMTKDVCDQCWGTGDANRKGVDLKSLSTENQAEVAILVQALQDIQRCNNTGADGSLGCTHCLALATNVLADTPAQAKALLRVVKDARRVPYPGAVNVEDALRALDALQGKKRS